MTSNRMEAKEIPGVSGRFCGDHAVPLGKTSCGNQWIYGDMTFVSMRGGWRCQVEHERDVLCPRHGSPRGPLANPVRHAVISGRQQRTKPLATIRSMGQDITRRDFDDVQIPGKKIWLLRRTILG